MFNNLNMIYKTTIEEENIEEIQRQKSIIEILLSKDEALQLLNKVEEKKIKKRQIQYFHSWKIVKLLINSRYFITVSGVCLLCLHHSLNPL